jgi:regulator of protease activity HflC (stomatin/prohibitin superfamily)
LLQERIRAYGLGLHVTSVAFQDVHPPLSVVEAYRDVSRAESDRQRRINEGETYRARILAEAQGTAARTVNRASADRRTRLARAAAESDRFLEQLSARTTAPHLTDQRLYWETIADALAGKPKVVLDPDKARDRHLILPDFPISALAPGPRAAPKPAEAKGP